MSEVSLAKQVESILFSSGKKVEIEELMKLCKTDKESIKKAISELVKKYDAAESSLMLVEEGTSYKLTVREQYYSLVKNIVTETELPRTIIETLAVVAWKAPVLQNKVISVRTNKAYDHLKFLEESGYITRQKQGRTKVIKLAQKFYDYFDLPKEKVKDRFGKFENVEKAITEKEAEAKSIKKAMEKQEKELKDNGALKVEKGIKQLFGDENAASEMPEMPQSDEVPAKKK